MPFCLLLVYLLMVPVLQSQESPPAIPLSSPTSYVEHQEKEFKFYPGGKVGISLEVPGSLKIIGWKKGSIRMEAEKIVHYMSEDAAKAFLKIPPVRVRYTDTSATIQVSGSPEPPGILETNLTIYVPSEKTDLTIQLNHGDLFMDTINGWIEATIADGSMEAKSVSGYFSGKTRRGNIYAEMSDNLWRGQEFGSVTQEGSIELRLPAKYSAALQLETRNGKIVVDYPPQMVDGEEVPPAILTKNNSQLLRASVGEGGAPLRLTTYSGNITLSLK
jgi:DUF4097 and DUF4098 domain-containing protein YvlB